MGIIAKQGLKSSILIYIGIGIGFINTIFLSPKLLSAEEIGFLSYVNSISTVFLAFFSLGINQLINRVYPLYKDKEFKDKEGFYSFILYTTIIGLLLGLFLFFLIGFSFENTASNTNYQWLFSILFPTLFIGRMLLRHTDPLIRMRYNTVLGSFLDNFLVKVFILICLSAFLLMDYKNFNLYGFLYISSFAIPGIICFFYVLYQKQFSVHYSKAKLFLKENKQENLTLMLYGTIGSAGAILVYEIDKIMIKNMLNLSLTGIYSIALFFSIFITVPGKSIKKIAVVLLSDAWKNNDLKTIESIYKMSSLNLFLMGVYLFLGIWINIDDVLSFLPKEYEQGKYVILILGIAQLIDLLTGVNIEVISTSTLYKFNTYFIFVMIALVLVTNYTFIPIWGINGAALASLISVLVTNFFRFLIIRIKYKIHPFSLNFLIIVGLGLVCYYGFSILSVDINPVVNILIKGSLLTVVYFCFIVLTKVSVSINGFINKYLGTNL